MADEPDLSAQRVIRARTTDAAVDDVRASLNQKLSEGLAELATAEARKKDLERELSNNESELIRATSAAEISKLNWEQAERKAAQATRELERLEDRIEKQLLLIHEGSKSLALLNSAAAAAMLALSQALVAGRAFQPMKPFIIGALASFLIGALAASTVAQPLIGVMVRTIRPSATTVIGKAVWASLLVTWLPRVAVLTFAGGATTVLAGLWCRM